MAKLSAAAISNPGWKDAARNCILCQKNNNVESCWGFTGQNNSEEALVFGTKR